MDETPATVILKCSSLVSHISYCLKSSEDSQDVLGLVEELDPLCLCQGGGTRPNWMDILDCHWDSFIWVRLSMMTCQCRNPAIV